MTWVIGAASLLGHGVMVSDIRVTLRTGESIDMVQKAYGVGNFILGGFAGSVRIGFDLLDSIFATLRLPTEQAKSHAWDPRWIATTWAPEAKRVFENAPSAERKLSSQFLLVGVSATEDTGVPEFRRVYVVRFAPPNFLPGFMKKKLATCCSIGSGAGLHRYKQTLKGLLNIRSGLYQAELTSFGWWGKSLAHALSRSITDCPRDGISRHLIVHTARLGETAVTNNDETIYPGGGESPIPFHMPHVARSYLEFLDMVKSQGNSASCAIC